MKRTIFAALAILILATSCRFTRDVGPASAQDAASTPDPLPPAPRPTLDSAKPILNLRYSEETPPRPDALSLDVYPASGANLPVMISVHGGGWFRGDKSQVDAKPAAFNARGFVFVSVNYRLIAEVNLTQQVKDVARAIAWVKQNIAQYGGDPARLFLMGHSSGAHLVSLIGTDETYLREEGLSFSDIKGVVSLDTQAYDMFTLMSNLTPPSGEVYWAAFGDDPEFWKVMSPLRHVEAGKDIPPFVVAYTGDRETRAYFSKQFFAALQEAGVPSLLLPAPEYAHEEMAANFGLPGDRVSEIVFEWLEGLL